MSNNAGRGCRIASRLIGYGGVLACLAAAAAWYYLKIYKTGAAMNRVVLFGIRTLPKQMLLLAAIAAVCVFIAIILRICASVRKSAAEEIVEVGSTRIPMLLGQFLDRTKESAAMIPVRGIISAAAVVIGCAVTVVAVAKVAGEEVIGRRKGIQISIISK